MIAVSFVEKTRSLGKPKDWPEGMPCSTLDVLDTIDPANANIPVVVSYWEPTAKELEVLNKKGRIGLGITGTGMPPVRLFVEAIENFQPMPDEIKHVPFEGDF